MKLRRFNDYGIRQFGQVLEALRQGEIFETPLEFLEANETSQIVSGGDEFEVRVFETRLELATFTDNLLTHAEVSDDMSDIGLWSWLAAALLDSTCPPAADGSRKPGQDYRHIPSTSWRDFYRHLLRGPVRILRLFKDNPEAAAIVMCQKPRAPGDFVEQLASRQERITNPAIIETANRLYFDNGSRTPKRGSSPNWRKPGTLRRFGDVLDQLDLTYDLYSMSADELAGLLPDEFSPYLK